MQNLIIKPADKGSVVVVMEKEKYLWEGYRQLKDEKYYKELEKPIYPETFDIITKIFHNLYDKKIINAKQRNYLIGDSEPRARKFYLLPKIHKEAASWSIPFVVPPGRPIVSDCGSETYRSAEFIDHFLNPLSTKHKSYIKDTYDFIEKIKNLNVPLNSILFTIDVDSLYTNINTQEGIRSIKNIFNKFHDPQRPDEEILKLLEINLTRNDFEFDQHFFLQIKGTAMGKKFAPAYADIFMAEWEAEALEKCSKKPLHYFRYLDDIWGVWTHAEQDFQHFIDTLNNHNPSIKLKSTINQESINFLDTTTFKGPKFYTHNILDTKVYFKDTDTHALLHKESYHPKHTFRGLVKSQLLRFHRICTQREDFLQATGKLFSALSSRGYTRTFLRGVLKTYLEPKPPQMSPAIPFVTTYSESTVKLVQKIKRNFKTTVDTHLGQDLRLIAAFRKNKNLKDHLVRAKLPTNVNLAPKNKTTYFKQLNWIQNDKTKQVFNLPSRASVHSSNCVYVITCKKCSIKYVGETGRTLHQRFYGHKQNIVGKQRTHQVLVQHFLTHGWESVQASVLECNPHWSQAQRKRAEKGWITRLDTLSPHGLNERLTFTPWINIPPRGASSNPDLVQ
ncbi:uncharacterized protein LOC118599729 [Oryzias melastigma]|uniref:uncharacterized protein LOC118599729 n=1 Tax=Oryzias melastigma TaxID=30732 RepID=UPI00168CAF87|nr:uncharacterized protein LOC118599729 [Oryzias melastigma]